MTHSAWAAIGASGIAANAAISTLSDSPSNPHYRYHWIGERIDRVPTVSEVRELG